MFVWSLIVLPTRGSTPQSQDHEGFQCTPKQARHFRDSPFNPSQVVDAFVGRLSANLCAVFPQRCQGCIRTNVHPSASTARSDGSGPLLSKYPRVLTHFVNY